MARLLVHFSRCIRGLSCTFAPGFGLINEKRPPDIHPVGINTFVNGTETGQALLDAIELERRKELIGEGHRWFDLKRTTKTINRLNCTVFCTLLPTDRAWTWPIPLTELNANSNITQNPGY